MTGTMLPGGPRLLVAVPLPAPVAVRAQAEHGALLAQDAELDTAQILARLHAHPTVQVLLVSSRVRVDAALLTQAAPQLRGVATCSAGVEHIDLTAARGLGVLVSSTPDVVTSATADMTLLLMLGAARRMREYGRIMDAGWRTRFQLGEMLGTDLQGKTLGLFGMGRIGQAVAHRARAFGLRIAYHNRQRLSAVLEGDARYCATLPELLACSQILSLHAPAGPGLAGLFDRQAFAQMPRGAILVNTARGGLVCEEDLIEALQTGQLAAAGLDVFAQEPAYDLRLRDLPQVFMAPHMGTATRETREAMGHRALDNVADMLAGRPARDGLG